MIKQTLNVTGPSAVRERLLKLTTLAPSAFQAATYVAASSLISTAMRLTPVDTGWLRSSRYVKRPVVGGSAFTVEVGFAATYAIFVHQINKAYIVGEWKFLKTAADYHASTMLNEIARMTAGLMAAGKTIDSVPHLHPDEPLDDTNRAALEGLAGRYRQRKSKRTIAKREAARPKNQQRIARESASALDAQRNGRRAPRPGRG